MWTEATKTLEQQKADKLKTFFKHKDHIFPVILKRSHPVVQLLISIWDAFKLIRSQRQNMLTKTF